ncbi:MAG: HEAT repeat domain-containing protein [Terriglobales bacterium]
MRRFVITIVSLGLSASCWASAPKTANSDVDPVVAAHRVLDQALHDSNAEKRAQAVAATGAVGLHPDAVRAVEAALHDKDLLVREMAAATLGEMQSRRSIPALRAALDDKPEVSFAAALSLWDMGDRSGRNLLVAVLTGKQQDSPGLVKGALRTMDRAIHNPGEMAMLGVQGATDLMGPAGMGLGLAEDATKDGNAPGRALAAIHLARDSDPATLAVLQTALTDKRSSVRAAVARALGRRGAPSSIAKLQPLLSDSHARVRLEAAAAILRLDDGRAARR